MKISALNSHLINTMNIFGDPLIVVFLTVRDGYGAQEPVEAIEMAFRRSEDAAEQAGPISCTLELFGPLLLDLQLNTAVSSSV
jgi:hypothetical protein